jgi:hypothetical protein
MKNFLILLLELASIALIHHYRPGPENQQQGFKKLRMKGEREPKRTNQFKIQNSGLQKENLYPEINVRSIK